MAHVQEYSLKNQDNTLVKFADFSKAYYDFDMPVISDSFAVSQQFLDLLHYNIKSNKVAFVKGPKDTYSIYAGPVLSAKIHGDHLVKLWMPNLIKQNKHTEFLTGTGTEYLVHAGFPDMIHGGGSFMRYAYDLKHLYVPKMKDMGQNSLKNSQIERLYTPVLEEMGDNSLYENETLTVFDAANFRKFGKRCLYNNNTLTEVSWPNLTDIGDYTLYANMSLMDVETPKLANVGRDCPRIFYSLRDINRAR
ncbi:MAG: hypothetical protein J5742_01920 [Alphaproteobacteria bacterium]|nr:hypothetical protein [Alphaproteobacteria bacterium]